MHACLLIEFFLPSLAGLTGNEKTDTRSKRTKRNPPFGPATLIKDYLVAKGFYLHITVVSVYQSPTTGFVSFVFPSQLSQN